MARLNEPPLSTESVEALKRRFIRQNREFAKINSSQSLRIRALECDVSRMLAENLSFREEILRLQNQLTLPQPTVETSEVKSVRNQLQAKLEEIGSLVAGLGSLEKVERPKRIQDPSTWRPKVPNLHLSGQEPRMPQIAEDKYYPRRTLEAEEIRALRLSDQSNESPDLGPPPVARFDCEDPIKFDPPAPKEPVTRDAEDEENLPAEMSVNLETRRKRKDCQSKVEPNSELRANVSTKTERTAVDRTGTKRKLNVRDSDDIPKLAPTEDFRYSRRSSNAADILKPKATKEATKATLTTNAEVEQLPAAPIVKERKVLGDKSVNMSPRKAAVSSKPGKKIDEDGHKPAHNSDTSKARARKPRTSAFQPVSVKIEPGLEPVEVQLEPSDNDAVPPTTPAPDLFSPPASEPSILSTTEGMDRRGNAVKGANLEGLTRPSRRVRSTINYAEPSLNTKMRRPDKSLVDAVYMRPTSNPPPSSEKEKKPTRIVFIKREADDDMDSAWKTANEANEPNSPSAAKAASLAQHQESRTSASRPDLEERAARRLSDKMQELEISDHKSYSPADQVVNARPTARQRRHSSIPAPVEADGAEELVSSSSPLNEADAKPAARPRVSFSSGKLGTVQDGRADRTSRRRSMMV
ncbi:hypothetical protein MBLNU457_g0469t1 [Dothideomycetes sp. NU457]